jgi:hypothetical protein
MNDRRLARLKLLAAGAAVVGSAAIADVPPPTPRPTPHIYTNSPRPQDVTLSDGGTLQQDQLAAAAADAGVATPRGVNGPPRTKPKK